MFNGEDVRSISIADLKRIQAGIEKIIFKGQENSAQLPQKVEENLIPKNQLTAIPIIKKQSTGRKIMSRTPDRTRKSLQNIKSKSSFKDKSKSNKLIDNFLLSIIQQHTTKQKTLKPAPQASIPVTSSSQTTGSLFEAMLKRHDKQSQSKPNLNQTNITEENQLIQRKGNIFKMWQQKEKQVVDVQKPKMQQNPYNNVLNVVEQHNNVKPIKGKHSNENISQGMMKQQQLNRIPLRGQSKYLIQKYKYGDKMMPVKELQQKYSNLDKRLEKLKNQVKNDKNRKGMHNYSHSQSVTFEQEPNSGESYWKVKATYDRYSPLKKLLEINSKFKGSPLKCLHHH